MSAKTDEPVPEGLGRTAVAVAWARARETLREDRLFDDPYAMAFIRAVAPERSPENTPRDQSPAISATRAAMGAQVVMRTRFFDDYLLAATRAGCRQVVLLAAGLDVRAYRLPWPAGTRVFELDLPDMAAFKDRVLRAEGAVPTCERIVVPADLLGPWAAELASAGFDPTAPTAWLVEGLLIYLSAEDAAALLTVLGENSAPGSRLSLTEGRATARSVATSGDPGRFKALTDLWKGGLGEPAADWLPRHGWRVTSHSAEELEQAYGRTGAASVIDGFLIAERAGVQVG